ncbi:hypothetical protein [Schumannella sp. 10F1B-5-1]|uniref:hypothetical protein n=1 Tax=Schumannella sp. 10F1B-5-1 TaxID=2590780 RepID=UPI0011316C7A|nr:hypothetical protein [Schumannella sp. 10F1B-5-1]TPW78396.1 hypothetical protein FJ658_00895 [Schumannella sp. 10F1B-5-1]
MVGNSGAVTWDEFVKGITWKRRQELVASLDIDEKIAMIARLDARWGETPGPEVARERKERKAKFALIEKRRAMAGRRSAEERQRDELAGRRYWAALERGRLRCVPVAVLAERARRRPCPELWLAMHPTGERTPDHLIRTFYNLHRRSKKRRNSWDPARTVAIKPDRAMEIAMRVLEQKEH